jgi:hypothetical protein
VASPVAAGGARIARWPEPGSVKFIPAGAAMRTAPGCLLSGAGVVDSHGSVRRAIGMRTVDGAMVTAMNHPAPDPGISCSSARLPAGRRDQPGCHFA